MTAAGDLLPVENLDLGPYDPRMTPFPSPKTVGYVTGPYAAREQAHTAPEFGDLLRETVQMRRVVVAGWPL